MATAAANYKQMPDGVGVFFGLGDIKQHTNAKAQAAGYNQPQPGAWHGLIQRVN